jgi:hypothetical protein
MRSNSRDTVRNFEGDFWKVKLIIHTHDSFKVDAKVGVTISDPMSHTSLAGSLIAEYRCDSSPLAVVRYHDEPVAMYRQFETGGKYNRERFNSLITAIKD